MKTGKGDGQQINWNVRGLPLPQILPNQEAKSVRVLYDAIFTTRLLHFYDVSGVDGCSNATLDIVGGKPTLNG